MKYVDFYIYGYFEPGSEVPFYIGKGRGKRAYVHLEPKHLQREQWPFHRRLRKMVGAEVRPRIEIIERGLTEDAAFAAERRLIATYGRRNNRTGVLLNLTDGGDGPVGRVVSQETRELLSQINTGKTVSPEVRAKMSAALKGRKHSPEHVARRAASRCGSRVRPETLTKMRDAGVRQMQNPEARARIAESNSRREWSPEARAEVSKANRGQLVPPERRERIGATLSKPVESYDPVTGEIVARYSSATVAGDNGFNPGKISAVCKGHRPQHRRLGWRFSSPAA